MLLTFTKVALLRCQGDLYLFRVLFFGHCLDASEERAAVQLFRSQRQLQLQPSLAVTETKRFSAGSKDSWICVTTARAVIQHRREFGHHRWGPSSPST